MSQYANFYAHKYGVFISLGSFHAGSIQYDTVHGFAPWEKLNVCSEQLIKEFLNNIKEEKTSIKERINQFTDMIYSVERANNPLEEKIDTIDSLYESLAEEKELLNEAAEGEAFFNFLSEILYDGNDTVEVLVGIECYNPTEEDVVR